MFELVYELEPHIRVEPYRLVEVGGEEVEVICLDVLPNGTVAIEYLALMMPWLPRVSRTSYSFKIC